MTMRTNNCRFCESDIVEVVNFGKMPIANAFLKKEDKTIIFVSHNRDNLIFCDLIYEVKEKNFSKVN